MKHRASGFTLIELIIAIALLSIVTTISVTSYRQYMIRANRTDATSVLLRIAAAQERWYLSNNQYSADPVELIGVTASEHAYYDVAIESDDLAAGYTANAEPVAGGRQSTDAKCQQFSIDETGLRESDPEGIDECWR